MVMVPVMILIQEDSDIHRRCAVSDMLASALRYWFNLPVL